MKKEEKIKALKYTKKVINQQIKELQDNGDIQTLDDEPCPKGKIRNANGDCVDGIG